MFIASNNLPSTPCLRLISDYVVRSHFTSLIHIVANMLALPAYQCRACSQSRLSPVHARRLHNHGTGEKVCARALYRMLRCDQNAYTDICEQHLAYSISNILYRIATDAGQNKAATQCTEIAMGGAGTKSALGVYASDIQRLHTHLLRSICVKREQMISRRMH